MKLVRPIHVGLRDPPHPSPVTHCPSSPAGRCRRGAHSRRTSRKTDNDRPLPSLPHTSFITPPRPLDCPPRFRLRCVCCGHPAAANTDGCSSYSTRHQLLILSARVPPSFKRCPPPNGSSHPVSLVTQLYIFSACLKVLSFPVPTPCCRS